MKMQNDLRFMEFRLGQQSFALPLLSVKEVLQKPEIVIVPNMPSHFEGMMNLRGQILGVYNVRTKLMSKIKSTDIDTSEVVIVIEQNNISVGMIVDEIVRVIHVDDKMIQPAPLKENDSARQYITFVIQSENELILALNISQLLEFENFKTVGDS